MYRLLDTTLTFYGVALEGQTLVYDISINSFAKKAGQVRRRCAVDWPLAAMWPWSFARGVVAHNRAR